MKIEINATTAMLLSVHGLKPAMTKMKEAIELNNRLKSSYPDWPEDTHSKRVYDEFKRIDDEIDTYLNTIYAEFKAELKDYQEKQLKEEKDGKTENIPG